MTAKNRKGSIGRRAFLAGAAAATVTVMKPSLVRGTRANETITLGLIGCGGRGNWLTSLFDKTGRYRFVALADYFPDRVDTVGDRLKVDPAHRYTTLSGYKRLLDEKLDAAEKVLKSVHALAEPEAPQARRSAAVTGVLQNKVA